MCLFVAFLYDDAFSSNWWLLISHSWVVACKLISNYLSDRWSHMQAGRSIERLRNAAGHLRTAFYDISSRLAASSAAHHDVVARGDREFDVQEGASPCEETWLWHDPLESFGRHARVPEELLSSLPGPRQQYGKCFLSFSIHCNLIDYWKVGWRRKVHTLKSGVRQFPIARLVKSRDLW